MAVSSTLPQTVMAFFRDAWLLIKEVARCWADDHVPSMGAALAYYTLFSLAPLLLIVISVAGMIFGEEAARGEIEMQLRSLMGTRAAGAVQDLLASVNHPAEGRAAAALGALLLLIGATTVFAELQHALDRIWRVQAPLPARQINGWMALLRARLLSFGMILAIGFLLMVSLLLSAALATLGRWWGLLFGGWFMVATVVNAVASFGFVAAMFALIYKLMPSASVQWRDVWTGAVFTALLFTLGKWLISLYVASTGVASAFGAAGSLVVLLLWVYYSAQIFLIGAEFTWVYANAFGSRAKARIKPADGDEDSGDSALFSSPSPSPSPSFTSAAPPD